jgi:hypothetical protein
MTAPDQHAQPFRSKKLVGGSQGYGIYEVTADDGRTHYELFAPGGAFIAPTHGTEAAAKTVMWAQQASDMIMRKGDDDEDAIDDEVPRPRP